LGELESGNDDGFRDALSSHAYETKDPAPKIAR